MARKTHLNRTRRKVHKRRRQTLGSEEVFPSEGERQGAV